MDWQKNLYLCEGLKVKIFEYHDNYLVSIVNFGCCRKFQGTCFGHTFSKTCQYNATTSKKEEVQRLNICLHQIFLSIFVKKYNMVLKIKERKIRMGESLQYCYKPLGPKIERTD